VTLLESEQFEQVAPNKPKEAIVMPPSEEGRRPPAKASAKAAAQATVTLRHLAAALADSHDIAKNRRRPCWATW
jgi:hypothetical protein